MPLNSVAKIKCDGCAKTLLPTRFSETGKRKYYESVRKNKFNADVPIKLPSCQNCNAGNRSELRCAMCSATKSLDHFAKAQRRHNENAHCFDCQQEKDDREPEYDDELQEVQIIDEMRKGQSMDGHSSLTSAGSSRESFQPGQWPSSRSEAPSLRSSVPGTDSWYQGNEPVPIPSDPQESSGRSYSDVGLQAAQDRSQQVSTLGDAVQFKNAKFAKPAAVKKDPRQKAMEQMQREDRREEARLEQAAVYGSDTDDEDELPY